MRALVILLSIVALPAWGGERLKQISTEDRFPVWGESAAREEYFAGKEEERLQAIAEAETKRAEEAARRAEEERLAAIAEAREEEERRTRIIVPSYGYGYGRPYGNGDGIGCVRVLVQPNPPSPEIAKYPPRGVRPQPKVASPPQYQLLCPGAPGWYPHPHRPRQGAQLQLNLGSDGISGGAQIVEPGFGLGLSFD